MATQRSGAGCLIIFGLIFVIAGSIPGCMAVQGLRLAQATRGWSETTATLLHVELVQGDETARIDARYRYRAPDRDAPEGGGLRDYEGTRVGVHNGSDNVGDWQAETCGRLMEAMRTGATVPCWYDPADPAQAVLDRGERWEMIGFLLLFPLIFGLVGGGIALLGFSQWRKARRPPADPHAEAQRREIPAEGGGACGAWVIAIVWNAMSWVAMVALLLKHEAPTLILLLVGLFPLIGLAILAGALLSTLRAVRYGRAVLRLEEGAWIGGQRVRAVVVARASPQPGDRIAARLRVVRRVTSGSGDDKSTRDEPLWTLDLAIEAQGGRAEGGRWGHPVELPLPGDLPAAGEDLHWRLEWQVIRPGPDLSATFHLPVVAGPADAGLPAAEVQAAADHAAPLAVLEAAGVRIADAGGTVEIALPPGRNPSLWVTGLGACAFLSIGAWALWHEVAWWTALLSLPLLALCWRGALRSALWRSRIVLTRERIAVRQGWWRLREDEVALRDVLQVERKSNMSSGDTAWFNAWLVTADGARIPIARGLPGPAAGRLADLIDRARR